MVDQRDGRPRHGFFSIPEMRYQNAYVWLVFVSALDIILTMIVLHHWEGEEVNPFAERLMTELGFGWAILFKFSMMLAAVISCEVVGRRNDRVGRRLSVAAVVINGFPVAFTLGLLWAVDPWIAAAEHAVLP